MITTMPAGDMLRMLELVFNGTYPSVVWQKGNEFVIGFVMDGVRTGFIQFMLTEEEITLPSIWRGFKSYLLAHNVSSASQVTAYFEGLGFELSSVQDLPAKLVELVKGYTAASAEGGEQSVVGFNRNWNTILVYPLPLYYSSPMMQLTPEGT